MKSKLKLLLLLEVLLFVAAIVGVAMIIKKDMTQSADVLPEDSSMTAVDNEAEPEVSTEDRSVATTGDSTETDASASGTDAENSLNIAGVDPESEAAEVMRRYNLSYGPYAKPDYTVLAAMQTDRTVTLESAATDEEILASITEAEETGEEYYVDYSIAITPSESAASPVTADEKRAERLGILSSAYMILIDADTGEIAATRDGDVTISPASMAKIMTVLTASMYVRNLTDTVTITEDIIRYVNENDCSAVGYEVGDAATIEDLFYGTIVASGADAALALAKYVAGSVDEFVVLMNYEAERMGIADTTHFTNPVGIYDEKLYSTPEDIATILYCALQSELCARVLSQKTSFMATSTDAEYLSIFNQDIEENGELYENDGIGSIPAVGIEINNWFLRRIKEYDTNGTVVAAKTGYVSEAGCCAASALETNSGKRYVLVTAKGLTSWGVVYDHIAVYRAYTE